MSHNMKLSGWMRDNISSVHFGQCVEAFKNCCDVLSIDGTFLTRKYEDTMLIVIGIDADHQQVPLAFAIVEKENSGSWGWFLRLARKVVVSPRC
jgi:hypothetical protein